MVDGRCFFTMHFGDWPLSSEHGTHEPVQARFWPWLSAKVLKPISVAGRIGSEEGVLGGDAWIVRASPNLLLCRLLPA